MLPNFLIIGAARSGTTSLYHNLCEHPDIFMSSRKEPHFFSSNWDQGMDWYTGHFDRWSGESAVGEASVSYTYPQFPDTVKRIAETLPDARLIYMVRNPVNRAFSHYQYYRHYSNMESRPFEEAIDHNPIYLGASEYFSWIQRYLEYFPAPQLKVLVFEEFTQRPLEVLGETFTFLGVDASFVPSSARLATNKAFRPWSPFLYQLYKKVSLSKFRQAVEPLLPERARPRLRNYVRAVLGARQAAPAMADETRQRLADLLAPGILRLESHLGREIPQWKS